jgi:phosphoenolpyruvate-protein kinase (PTS system EI component)
MIYSGCYPIEEHMMNKRVSLLVLASALCTADIAAGQGMILDAVANKVISKYQNSTCDQLRQEKNQPKSSRQEKVVQFLRNDPQARTAFLNQVAAPIVNKLFECGMIP